MPTTKTAPATRRAKTDKVSPKEVEAKLKAAVVKQETKLREQQRKLWTTYRQAVEAQGRGEVLSDAKMANLLQVMGKLDILPKDYSSDVESLQRYYHRGYDDRPAFDARMRQLRQAEKNALIPLEQARETVEKARQEWFAAQTAALAPESDRNSQLRDIRHNSRLIGGPADDIVDVR